LLRRVAGLATVTGAATFTWVFGADWKDLDFIVTWSAAGATVPELKEPIWTGTGLIGTGLKVFIATGVKERMEEVPVAVAPGLGVEVGSSI